MKVETVNTKEVDEAGKKIKGSVETATKNEKEALKHYREAGAQLIAARPKVDAIFKATKKPVYRWGRWVEDMTGRVQQYANLWMWIAENWEKVKHCETIAEAIAVRQNRESKAPERRPLTLDSTKKVSLCARLSAVVNDPAALLATLQELGVAQTKLEEFVNREQK